MTSEGKAVLENALALSPVERASVISALLASFDRASRATLDAAWATEAEDRIDAHPGLSGFGSPR
ncbi:MAG: addiction module protein [Acidobacteria bacterium]|nr:addiction module protein [Acidobacteriota bacterium]